MLRLCSISSRVGLAGRLPPRPALSQSALRPFAVATHAHPHSTSHHGQHANQHSKPAEQPAPQTQRFGVDLEHTHPVSPEVAINPATGAHVHQLHLPFKTRLTVEDIRKKKGFIIDMDGVMYHGKSLLPGAQRFVRWLQESKKDFLFLTNSSERSPRELKEKLSRLGIQVDAHHFYTSALATAVFLSSQQPNGSCYVIGEPGLISALYDAGFSMNEVNPDFVVVGETRNYTYERIEHAVHLVRQGARLIGTNVDVTDKMHGSFVPACGSLIKPIEMASGRQAYFVGKPNPLIMRNAMRHMNVNRGDTVILGDRMDTDILGGIQSEIDAVLVLSGVTTIADVGTYSYRPDCVLEGVGSLPPAEFK